MAIGYVWSHSLIPDPHLPDVTNWGWKKLSENDISPVWTLLPEASKACRALFKCKCKKGCIRNCKCRKEYQLPCTELCWCRGQCGKQTGNPRTDDDEQSVSTDIVITETDTTGGEQILV